MKSFLKFLLILVFSVSVLTGFIVGASVVSANVTPQNKTPDREIPQPTAAEESRIENGQRNLVVFAIDRLDNPAPNLEAVWLVLRSSSSPNLSILPLFPSSLEGGPAEDAFLKNSFQLQPDGTLHPDFVSALQSKELWWHNYAVVDESGWALLIDLVGGIDAGNGLISGTAVVAGTPKSWENSQAALEGQISIAKSLCNPVRSDTVISDPTPEILALLSQHVRTDLDLTGFVKEWQEIRLTGRNRCKFPTLDQGSETAPVQ